MWSSWLLFLPSGGVICAVHLKTVRNDHVHPPFWKPRYSNWQEAEVLRVRRDDHMWSMCPKLGQGPRGGGEQGRGDRWRKISAYKYVDPSDEKTVGA